MEDFDYSMIDLKLIDMTKLISDFYYEDCEKLLTEVLMKRPDYDYIYHRLKLGIYRHYYFTDINDLKNFLEE